MSPHNHSGRTIRSGRGRPCPIDDCRREKDADCSRTEDGEQVWCHHAREDLKPGDRIGEYAFVRPGREMLFAPLDAESKYKAKNFIDTVVYRAGDAMSGWLKSLLDMLAQGAWLVALVGAASAALWGLLGWYLGGQADQKVAAQRVATT